jgi:hypothetical protein
VFGVDQNSLNLFSDSCVFDQAHHVFVFSNSPFMIGFFASETMGSAPYMIGGNEVFLEDSSI